MNDTAILLPVLALVGWTMGIAGLMGYRRVTSGLGPKNFRLGESTAVPPHVALPNRNYMNQLEAPVLFYVVAICTYVTQQAAVALAGLWGLLLLRLL